jgi:glycosyltransferase involved in cell wall biosynthesis
MSLAKMDPNMEGPFKNIVRVFRDGNLLPIPNRKMQKCPNPKVSIIIPMYNEEKNAKSIIRSLQNQTLQEIEIICVNDNSNDKTLSILQSMQKEDPRIEIITNKTNRGVIYNRIHGALQSKGEYVTFVDADDGLCNYDILTKAYNCATKDFGEKIDMIHYQSCGCKIKDTGEMEPFCIFFTFNPTNFNKILRQPEIGDNYMQKKNHISGSGFVFDKIYSRELMLRVADYIGPHIWNQNLIFVDDFLLCFACMKQTKSLVNIGEIGYWHKIEQETSATSRVFEIDGDRLLNPDKSNRKIGDYMIILGRILELTDNEPQMAEFRESQLKELVKEQFLPSFARSVHYDTFLRLFDKLYSWKYQDEEGKKRIRNYVKTILSYKLGSERKYAHLLK